MDSTLKEQNLIEQLKEKIIPLWKAMQQSNIRMMESFLLERDIEFFPMLLNWAEQEENSVFLHIAELKVCHGKRVIHRGNIGICQDRNGCVVFK